MSEPLYVFVVFYHLCYHLLLHSSLSILFLLFVIHPHEGYSFPPIMLQNWHSWEGSCHIVLMLPSFKWTPSVNLLGPWDFEWNLFFTSWLTGGLTCKLSSMSCISCAVSCKISKVLFAIFHGRNTNTLLSCICVEILYPGHSCSHLFHPLSILSRTIPVVMPCFSRQQPLCFV